MDEMINALTKGIGADLYKPLRIAYYNKKSFLEQDTTFKKCAKDKQQFLIDVMALSLFNQQIILPYHGAANFASGTKSYGVTRIRMASYHLDKEFYVQSNKITRQFFAITKSYGINVEMLHISSTSEFISSWLQFIKNNG